MTTDSETQTAPWLEAPLTRFSKCHMGIVSQLQTIAGLPALIVAAAQCRAGATSTLALFEHAVVEHHAEEERELFPVVLQSAGRGEEHDRVQAIVRRLTAEHRAIEFLWKSVAPAIRAAAANKPADLDPATVDELVHCCMAHANFEEQQFLPLAETILSRNGNHMAALGLSIHLRHAPQPIGHI